MVHIVHRTAAYLWILRQGALAPKVCLCHGKGE